MPDHIVASAMIDGIAASLGRTAYGTVIAAAFLLLLAPLLLVIWLSLFQAEIPQVPPSGYSLKWFGAALGNEQFTSGMSLSLRVAVIATLCGLLVSIPASLAVVRGSLPFRSTIVQLLTAPMIVPAIVIGASLYMVLIQLEVLTDASLVGSTVGLVAGHILVTIPWCVRLITANLVGVNRTIEEAAGSLGARPLTVLLKVTLPAILPGVIAAALFSFVVSFGNLEISLFLVAPGQITLPIAVLQYLEWRIDPSVAAISVLQIAIITAALLVTDRFVPLSRVV